MKIKKCFLAQQTTTADEMSRFVTYILSTGKVEMQVPPDCFIWAGTKEELEEAINKFKTEK